MPGRKNIANNTHYPTEQKISPSHCNKLLSNKLLPKLERIRYIIIDMYGMAHTRRIIKLLGYYFSTVPSLLVSWVIHSCHAIVG